jgi:hypothetical protein
MGVVAGAVLKIAGDVVNSRAQAKQAEAQGKAIVSSMNRDFMNLEIQRQDEFDAAVKEIADVRLNAARTGATLDVAVNEDLGDSSTGKLLKRSAKASEARAVSAIQDQYSSKSGEIDLNKETTLLNAKAAIGGIQKPSKTAFAIRTLSTVAGAYTSAQNQQAQANADGMDWNLYTGAKTRKKVNPGNG